MNKKKTPKSNPKFPKSEILQILSNDTGIPISDEVLQGVVDRAAQSFESGVSTLQEMASRAKQLVDDIFIDVTDHSDDCMRDTLTLMYSVKTRSNSRRFFWFRDPIYIFASPRVQWCMSCTLRAWQNYEHAVDMEDVGYVEGAIECQKLAQEWEKRYDDCLEEIYLYMTNHYSRLQGAKKAKRHKDEAKRKRRKKRVKELYDSGKVKTPWKAAIRMAHEEGIERKSMYEAIKNMWPENN
jgi:hypothetical protein